MAARFLVVPGAPFIDIQADLPGGIILVHDRGGFADDLVNVQGMRQGRSPFAFRKAGGRPLVAEDARHGVVMHAQPVELAAVPHHGFGKIVVIVMAAAGDLQAAHLARGAGKGGIAAIDVGGVFGAHVAAAAPGLVADADEMHVPGLGAAVPAPLIGQRGFAVRGHVFQPLGGIVRRQRADIQRDIGIRPDQLGKIHELVGAEAVILGHAAPMDIDPHGPLGARPDAVAPIVKIAEAAARPAHVGHMDGLQRRHHVLAIAMDVGDLAVLPHPDAFIDAAPQMLGELAIDMAVDLDTGPGGIDGDMGHRNHIGGRRLRAGRNSQSQQRQPKNFADHVPTPFYGRSGFRRRSIYCRMIAAAARVRKAL